MRPSLAVVRDDVPVSARAIDAFSREGDSDLQEIVNLVQDICEVQYAAISLVDGDDYHLLVTAGIAPLSCASSETLCVHTMDCHFGVFVEDASTDPRFAASPYVDGSLMSLRFYGSAPLYAPDGTMVGRLCVFDDRPRTLTPLQERTLVTLAANISGVLALRMRQQEDAALRAEHVAASEEVLRVAAQISHDMRIPLTALTTSLEMLHETNPPDMDPIRMRVFAGARRSAARMSRLVEGILRLNDVHRSLSTAEVDLARLVQQVVTDTGPVLQQARASVRVDTLPVVDADADQLYSVVLNLITNAVKFARPGVPPDIAFSSERIGHRWRIRVRDNGIGIPEDKRQQVFSIFSRLNTSVEGHGIGLATVARIVQAHGGEVGIADIEGAGTEIWFELPERAAGTLAPVAEGLAEGLADQAR